MLELRHKVKNFSDQENFSVLLMDEIKIKENLVWDNRIGELISYVDLDDICPNYDTLWRVTIVASYVIVFLIHSLLILLDWFFYEDQECGILILPKLCIEHIKLTPTPNELQML